MNDDNKSPQGKLPITAELGDEGGSYGDATAQAETFGSVGGNPRVDPKQANRAAGELPAIASQGEQLRESEDTVKHATEPPDPRKR